MNSAARLNTLLTVARGTNASRARQGWATVLDVDPADTVALLNGMSQMLSLIRQAEVDLQRLKGHNTDLHLEALREIEAAFGVVDLNESWGNVLQRLEQSAVRALAYTGEALRVATGASQVPQATLQQLSAHLEDLIEEVEEADVDEELRREMLRYLNFARRALVEYRIRGIEGLREARDLNLAIFLRAYPTAQDSRKAATALKSLWNFLSELDTAISLTGFGMQLAPAAVENIKALLAAGS